MSGNSGNNLLIKVLFEGDTNDLPVRQFVGDLDSVHAVGGRVNDTLGLLGPIATASLVTAGVAAASALTGALLAAADASARVEKGVMEIGTLVGGMSRTEIKSMTDELTRMSIMSGQAIEPLIRARYDIVSAGFTSAADSATMLDRSARLAVGGVTSVSTAADLLTTIVNAYGLKAADAATVSDDLFTVVRNGKTRMDDLGASMGQLIATAGPMGVSLDELGAGLSALTSQGQATAIASTSLSAAVLELAKPSDTLVKALHKAGIESDNLIASGHGLKGALELLKQASEETGIPINKLIQREEGLRAIMPLLSSASEKFANDLASMSNNAGSADAAFQQMSGSSAMLKDQVGLAFDAAKRSVGEAIIETDLYKDTLKGLKGFFDEIAGASSDASKGVELDASVMEKALRSVGKAAREVAIDIQSIWTNYSEPIDRFEKSWNGKNSYQVLVGKIETNLKQTNSANNYSNDAENDFVASLPATTGKLKEVAGQAATTAKSLGKTNASSDKMSAAAMQEAHEITKAVEWYRKHNEQIPGTIALENEQADAMIALNRLLKLHIISDEDYVIAIDEASMRLAQGSRALAQEMEQDSAANIYGQFGLDSQGIPTEGIDEFSKAAKTIKDASEKMQTAGNAISSLGSQLGGRIGSGISGIGQGLNVLGTDTSQMTDDQKALNSIAGYTTIAAGIGTTIGGSIGKTISSTASMVSTGATLGSIFPGIGTVAGGIIGGVIGLVSSLFGGDNGRAQRDQSRDSLYQSIVSSAMNGGTESIKLLRSGGYTYSGVANMDDIYKGTGDRLLEDRGLGGLSELSKIVSVLDQASIEIASFAKPSIVTTLSKIGVEYEYAVAQSGKLVEVEQARIDSMIIAVTSVSADTIGSMISDVVASNPTGDAGKAFSVKLESSVAQSIREMAISDVVTDSIMPVLQPVMSSLVTGLVSGSLTSSEMASMYGDIKAVTEQIAPMVTTLAESFSQAGIGYAVSSQQIVTVLDQAAQEIASFATPSILTTLQKINTEYEYAVSLAGNLADLDRAKIDAEIVAITSVSNDSIKSIISDVVASNPTGEAGKAFSDKLESSVAQSIRDMAISNVVTDSIMPVLQPVMSSLVTGLVSGSLTSSEMASMYGGIRDVTEQLAPVVTTLAESFLNAGIGYSASSSSSLSTQSYSSYADYLMASAGIPGFADGGDFSGGFRIVGERGPELEQTGPSRIYSSSETMRMLDNRQVVEELRAIREEMRAGQYAIAKNVEKTARVTEKWDADGLPATTTAT